MSESQRLDEPPRNPDAADESRHKQLEAEIYARADELAQMLTELRGASRSLARRGVIETLRDVPLDPPVEEPRPDPAGTQNFGAFGVMVVLVGLLFLPVIPSMAAAFLVLGIGISLLSFLTSRWSGREPPEQKSQPPANREKI
jgi:hypothetical protein